MLDLDSFKRHQKKREKLLISIEDINECIKSKLITHINRESLTQSISSYLYCYISCSAHKVYELSLAAVEFIKTGKIVSAANPVRAVIETAAALDHVYKVVFKSLGKEDTTSIWNCLEELSGRINTIEMVKAANLGQQHNDLSEVVHHNAWGNTVHFTCIDYEKSLIHLGSKNFAEKELNQQTALRDFCIEFLEKALRTFAVNFVNIYKNRDELDKYPPYNQRVLSLPTIRSNFSFDIDTSNSFQEESLGSIRQSIKDLQIILIKKFDLEIFKAGTSGRLWHYKAAISHRMYELSESALEKIEKNEIMTAMCLIRSTMETASALKYIRKKVHNSLKKKDLTILDRTLDRAILGFKNPPKFASSHRLPESQHVNDFLKDQNEEFRSDYDRLCEFIHPTLVGIIEFYACMKHDNDFLLLNSPYCKKLTEDQDILHRRLKSLCIRTLINSLFCFIEEEKIINQNMMELVSWRSLRTC